MPTRTQTRIGVVGLPDIEALHGFFHQQGYDMEQALTVAAIWIGLSLRVMHERRGWPALEIISELNTTMQEAYGAQGQTSVH